MASNYDYGRVGCIVLLFTLLRLCHILLCVCVCVGLRLRLQGRQLQLGKSHRCGRSLHLRHATQQRPSPRHQQHTNGRRWRKFHYPTFVLFSFFLSFFLRACFSLLLWLGFTFLLAFVWHKIAIGNVLEYIVLEHNSAPSSSSSFPFVCFFFPDECRSSWRIDTRWTSFT